MNDGVYYYRYNIAADNTLVLQRFVFLSRDVDCIILAYDKESGLLLHPIQSFDAQPIAYPSEREALEACRNEVRALWVKAAEDLVRWGSLIEVIRTELCRSDGVLDE